MINRPTTAWTIELTDEELAKVGLLALLDSQCQMAIASALKAVARLDFEAWRRLASTPLEQLLTRLVDAARPIDIELMHLAEEAQAKKDVLVRRHQAVHGIWANDKSVDGIRAWDIKRGLHLATLDLDAAISDLGAYTLDTRRCLVRAAELIREGVLPGGIGSTKGPHYNLDGTFVQL